jgi:multiple antibiotic resistance protein
MSLFEYILFATTSLFIIIDPVALIPIFLGMTPHDTPRQRIKMARLACLVAAGVLIGFTLTGELVFRLMGITLPAFKIAGSIVLLLIALDMLRARRSPVQQTQEETDAAAEKDDIAITPLAVPMLAGPGAISTGLLLKTQAQNWSQELALYGCIVGVLILSYFILRLASHGVAWVKPIAMKILTRLMGLLVAAVAIQFMLDALAELRGELF